MPTQEKREQRRARAEAMLERVDQELQDSERSHREPSRGVILSALRWEIAARAEAVSAIEDVTCDLLAEVTEISGRQAGAIATVDALKTSLQELKASVSGLRNDIAVLSDKIAFISAAVSRNTSNIEMTRGDLAIARAKWIGWRGLIFSVGITIHELIKFFLGGAQ